MSVPTTQPEQAIREETYRLIHRLYGCRRDKRLDHVDAFFDKVHEILSSVVSDKPLKETDNG